MSVENDVNTKKCHNKGSVLMDCLTRSCKSCNSFTNPLIVTARSKTGIMCLGTDLPVLSKRSLFSCLSCSMFSVGGFLCFLCEIEVFLLASGITDSLTLISLLVTVSDSSCLFMSPAIRATYPLVTPTCEAIWSCVFFPQTSSASRNSMI